MAVKTSEVLKGYFNDGDTPVESNYIDLIDTIFSMGEGGDMLKATYDTDSDSVVDNSEQLNGYASVDSADVNAHVVRTTSAGLIRTADLSSVRGAYIGGSGFPANPATGQIFFRTDLGFLCFYNGANWLTCTEYGIECKLQSASAQTQLWFSHIRSDYAPYYTRISYIVNVNSANNGNNGSNYWTLYVRSANNTFSQYTTVRSFNTSAMTVNTWTLSEANASINNPSNYSNFDVWLTKTGSPGVIQAMGTVYHRFIIA